MAKADRDPNLFGRFATEDPLVIDFIGGMSQADLGIKYAKTTKAVESYLRRRKLNSADVISINIDNVIDMLSNGKTLKEISNSLAVDTGIINRALRRANITINWQAMRRTKSTGVDIYKDIDNVVSLYKNGKPAYEIANMYGISSDSTVRSLLKNAGVNIRIDGIHQLKAIDKFAARKQLDDRDYLNDLYINQTKTSYEIADIIGVGQAAVLRSLKKFGIELRSSLESNKRKLGSYHQEVIDYLNTNQVDHQTSYIYSTRWNRVDKRWEFDEYLPDHKIFLEIQGEYWHGIDTRAWNNSTVRSKMWADLFKYKTIRRDMPDHKIIYLTNKETNLNKLGKILKFSTCVYEPINKNIVISVLDVETAKEFLDKYHYLGYTIGKHYGVFQNNDLICVCTISQPTRQTIKSSLGGQNMKEITRIVRKDGIPANTLSYSISRILKLEKASGTDSVISFADPTPWRKSQHDGALYKSLNFEMTGETSSNYCYADGSQLLHKRTVYGRAKRANMTEAEYVMHNKLYKLPEWPKLKFEKML